MDQNVSISFSSPTLLVMLVALLFVSVTAAIGYLYWRGHETLAGHVGRVFLAATLLALAGFISWGMYIVTILIRDLAADPANEFDQEAIRVGIILCMFVLFGAIAVVWIGITAFHVVITSIIKFYQFPKEAVEGDVPALDDKSLVATWGFLNPGILGVLNTFVPGLGYWIIGVRAPLFYMLVPLSAAWYGYLLASSPGLDFMVVSVVLGMVFGLDAWVLAVSSNKEKLERFRAAVSADEADEWATSQASPAQ